MTKTPPGFDQEGLPDYWGIETFFVRVHKLFELFLIRKDYPTTGVLKLKASVPKGEKLYGTIRKDYPTTGVLKLANAPGVRHVPALAYQEGLPDYWGIETHASLALHVVIFFVIRKDYPTTGVLKPRPDALQY